MKELAKVLSLGGSIVISILLPVLAGRWVDERLYISPLGVLVGLFLGLAMAFYHVYEITK